MKKLEQNAACPPLFSLNLDWPRAAHPTPTFREAPGSSKPLVRSSFALSIGLSNLFEAGIFLKLFPQHHSSCVPVPIALSCAYRMPLCLCLFRAFLGGSSARAFQLSVRCHPTIGLPGARTAPLMSGAMHRSILGCILPCVGQARAKRSPVPHTYMHPNGGTHSHCSPFCHFPTLSRNC